MKIKELALFLGIGIVACTTQAQQPTSVTVPLKIGDPKVAPQACPTPKPTKPLADPPPADIKPAHQDPACVKAKAAAASVVQSFDQQGSPVQGQARTDKRRQFDQASVSTVAGT